MRSARAVSTVTDCGRLNALKVKLSLNPLLYKIATWGGYLACLYFTCCLLWDAHSWYVTICAYGQAPWRQAKAMLAFVAKSENAPDLYWPACPLAVIAAFYLLNGPEVPVPFTVSLVLFQLHLYVYQSKPPSVLVLGTSRPETVDLRERIERGVYPYRVVVLLEPSTAIASTHSKFTRNLFEWDNLRARDGDWRSVVHPLMDMVPIVLIDARVATPGVLEETRRMLESNSSRRVVFLVEPGGASPVLASITEHHKLDELCTVDEVHVVALLKKLGLSKTTSPDDAPLLWRLSRKK